MIQTKNIFSDIPEFLPKELFENIMSNENCKVERIISQGHVTPEGKWYDQNKNEFVILLKGTAELLFESKNQRIRMKEGDYINIPAHIKHRVIRTDSKGKTIWLTVFY